LGKPWTSTLHTFGSFCPNAMLKYSVKLLATAAFEKTYSISIFAPAKYPKNSPTAEII